MRLLLGITVLALAGCGQSSDDTRRSGEELQTSDVQAPRAAPGIDVTAAPGVAFRYAYEFRLPPAAIAGTQEAHAQTCEKLGILRCRITGMRYRLIGENDVEGMLAFKLDPSIARQFGKTGIDAVNAAKGKLVDAAISGADAGAEIAAQARAREQLTEEAKRLERELAKAGRSATERAELQRQRADLQRQQASSMAATAEQRESLANTPMEFRYSSGAAIRGFDASAPFTSAIDTATASLQVTLAVLLGAVALLGPPGVLLLLLWLGWRRFRARRPQPETASPA